MENQRPKLPSTAIPQADNPRILVRMWRHASAGGVSAGQELGVHPRQVTYYNSALRILGLTNDDAPEPPAGDPIPDDAIAVLKNRFEKSACGRAWLEWAGANHLEEVDPETAREFLAARSDLSGTTLDRRSTTLRRWHAWMTGQVSVSENTSPIVLEEDESNGETITLGTAYGHYAPREWESGVNWTRWTYNDWNDRLVDHYFAFTTSAENEPVTRIPATPDELASIAGADPAEAAAVAAAFVARITEQLPYEKRSFCGFCLDYDSWSPRAPEPPHFFAMLWFTCLVAYGYPTGEGAFYQRLRELLGKPENFQTGGRACLPRLWEDLAAWTRARRQSGDPIRELELPPRSEHRPVIGYSHFLAFPNRVDRNALARVLWEAGLVGFEPPVQPVLDALARARKLFGKDFVEDMDAFGNRYAEGDDPRDSAFWKAVRQEALEPSADPSQGNERGPRTWLLFLEDEQGLRPIVGCRLEQLLPEGFQAHPFEEPVNWAAYVTGADGDLDAAWQEAFHDGRLLPVGARKLIAQGVLVLRESGGGELEVVHGADIHGCRRALVTTSRVDAFLRAFPGTSGPARTQPSVIDGWIEVDGCEVRQVGECPPGLDGVTQVLRTMSPPSVALVGGVRASGGFLFVPGFLPLVRSPGAQAVNVVFNDGRTPVACVASADRAGDWYLPAKLERADSVVLRASWSLDVGGRTVERSSDTRLRFVQHVVDDRYRGKPSGHYYVESCPDPEADVVSASEVPLGISTSALEMSADMLEFDASARFLGPGVGEMALEPREGFDWLVVGKKKNPELLVFVGDPTRPSTPAPRRSASKGDVRHWRRGFDARQVLVRLQDGSFTGLDQGPAAVREAFKRYRSHKVEAGSGDEIPATGLETQVEVSLARATPDPATTQAVDVLAALASRRAGLTYSEVREVFEALLDTDDPIELQQIIRGWTESGLVDMLRSAQVSRFVLVPRVPRLVLVRRGPEVEATVVGLVSSVRRRHIDQALAQLNPSLVKTLSPANPWQPDTLRIRGTASMMEALRVRAGLGASEWLRWPPKGTPPSLDISGARARIQRTEPPASFRFDAGWDWSRTSFYRGHHGEGPIRLERRVHVDSSTIYVLTSSNQPVLWTYSRAWSLLEAYAARGVPAFRADRGVLTTTGRAPVHLPLPVGRLCVLIGEGLPGPSIGSDAIRYSYPFGPRLFELVERVLPSEWLDTSSNTSTSFLSSRSIHAGPHR